MHMDAGLDRHMPGKEMPTCVPRGRPGTQPTSHDVDLLLIYIYGQIRVELIDMCLLQPDYIDVSQRNIPT